MTNNEASKLLKWFNDKATPKPVKGYIYVFGSVVNLFNTSDYDKECALKHGYFIVFPNDKGFTIRVSGISCQLKNGVKLLIPFRYIQLVRLYNYNY